MSRVTLNRFAARSGILLVCATLLLARHRFTSADTPPPSLAPEAALPASAPTEPTAPPPPFAPTTETSPPTTAAQSPETPEPTATPEPEATPTTEAPPVISVETPPASEKTEADNLLAAKRQKWVPYYQTVHPAWGFEFTGSISAFGGNDIEASQAGSPARGLQFGIEYLFPFFQTIGVLSLGPSFAFYPITPNGTVTSNAFSLWSLGGEVRYQARFFREQPLVPVGGFEYQYLTYHFSDGNSGATGITSPFVGAMFLLNILEPSSAAELFIEQGISRSYLLAEFKNMSGGNGTVTISGMSIFFGLRLEF